MHVILASVGIHTNPYIASLTIKPYSSHLLVLQCRLHTATEEGFEKHEFLKCKIVLGFCKSGHSVWHGYKLMYVHTYLQYS